MKMLGIRMYCEPPCQNCPDREIGCHGKCPKYKGYLAELSALKAKAKAEQSPRTSFVWGGYNAGRSGR